MEMVKDPEPADRRNPFDEETRIEGSDTVKGDNKTSGNDSTSPTAEDLPVEPLLAWTSPEGEATPDGYDAVENLRRLRRFYLYGRLDPDAVHSTDGSTIPAFFYQYRDLSRRRYDYPLCVNGSDPDASVRPLRQVIDDLVAEVSDDSDAGERRSRRIYKLELAIKSMVDTKSGGRLSELADRAAQRVVASSKLSGDKKDVLMEDLAVARDGLQKTDRVISCNAETAGQLFTAHASADWAERCAGWREDVEVLICRLQDVLNADFNRSPQAKSAKRLRESVGERAADDIDFGEMSSILSGGEPSPRMAKSRRERVSGSLSTLLEMKAVFDAEFGSGEDEATIPIRIDQVFENCASAVDAYEDRMRKMVSFFKGIRVARLEVENSYRQSVHDEFFDGFDMEHLTGDELSLCPPVLLRLKSDNVTETGTGVLLEILSSGVPIKILFEVEDIFTRVGGATAPSTVSWRARLAGMAVALDSVYVLQAPVSAQSAINTGFAQGLRYPGPALFSVYVGTSSTRPALSTFLDAAASAESRSFPVLTFDPGKGETLAERIDILENSQSDIDWPNETFAYRTADGEVCEVDLGFTTADYLLCDSRLSEQFWCPAPAQWHEDMVPLHEYLREAREGDTRIPYLLTVDGEGRLARAIVTRAIVLSVLRCASHWRHVQEMGGINNSFALNLVAKEKQRLAEEKRCEVDAIEKNYVEQMDQDLGELTREIVQRIANRLIIEAGGGDNTPITPLAESAAPGGGSALAEATVADEAVKEAAQEEVEEEEDEVTAFDDPYIDTPLCTSCNECTQLNGQIFAYNDNKQAFIQDPSAGPYKDLVRAAELCPVRIIHPGKPRDSSEPGVDELLRRAQPFI
ncbi:MAG: ferredoxin [Candidatus Krumholzibacteria bacterium]|nr:ferredoxin [Candidatus Krumholzibacteria bacterium]